MARRLVASLVALALVAAPFAVAAPGPTSLGATLEQPGWAIGFFWTYHYDGPSNQEVSGFQATSLNDTYTTEVIAEASTAQGDAWIIRNTHAGSMDGYGPGGIPGTATYTSLSFYYYRKSDLAVLNFTQDIDIIAHFLFQTITGHGHNESTANPPLQQVAFGTPADGTRWQVFTNISSTGWYQIESSPRVNVSSYLVLDYNLSVNRTEVVAVPAGSFEVYNISGNGTANSNGTVYNFTEQFLWGPRAQGKVVDEAHFELMSLYVNRPPGPMGLLPVVRVDAGGSNNSVNVSQRFADPENDPFTLACSAGGSLTCSVDAQGILTVTAAPGNSATLRVNITADDSFPGGNATYPMTVLVNGTSPPNQPPTLVGSTTVTTPEDIPLAFVFASHYTDPDDTALTYQLELGAALSLLQSDAAGFSASAPTNFNGDLHFVVRAFDSAANELAVNFTLVVTPVNDPPALVSSMDGHLFAHTGPQALAVSVSAGDIDGDEVTVTWTLDGADVASGEQTSIPIETASGGDHALVATARDPSGAAASASFVLTLFVGPSISSATPDPTLRIASGSSILFLVNATDPDSTSLDYRWQIDGTTVSQAAGASNLSRAFSSAGAFVVRVTVADNGSSVNRSWTVTVESVPPGLVAIVSPLDGAQLDLNGTVDVVASIDARLGNLSVSWRLDGAVFATGLTGTTPRLSTLGNHFIDLAVAGTYNDTVPFSTVLSVHVSVVTPAANNSTDGTGNPPPPSDVGLLWLVVLVLALAAGAAVAIVVWRRQRRRDPPTA
jgi:hypothetical protein